MFCKYYNATALRAPASLVYCTTRGSVNFLCEQVTLNVKKSVMLMTLPTSVGVDWPARHTQC